MLKHYIIVKYIPEVTQERKAQLLQEIKQLFEHLLELDGIYAVDVCPNVIDRHNRYDLMIEIEMEDEATLCRYDDCIWHHQWKEQFGYLVEKKTIFDR